MSSTYATPLKLISNILKIICKVDQLTESKIKNIIFNKLFVVKPLTSGNNLEKRFNKNSSNFVSE